MTEKLEIALATTGAVAVVMTTVPREIVVETAEVMAIAEAVMQ